MRPSSVDLPEPEGPTTETNWPSGIVRLTSSRMVSASAPEATRFVTLYNSIMLHLLPACSILLACLAFAACGNGDTRESVSPQPAAPAPAPASNPGAPKIIAFGDSLTAGYGLASERESYPALLQEMLRRDGYEYEVVNAGVSGHTSADGLARIDWALEGHENVRFLVLGLGANDLLRGRPVAEM